jgi:predicted RNA binding protein YcfA (HicA-like mRNA interferase family)
MPKFPGLSGADLVKALERLGFQKVRQTGSHLVLRKGSVGCVVPKHRELKVGTVNGILKQAGISAEELRDVL